jgi:hypothetical protein
LERRAHAVSFVRFLTHHKVRMTPVEIAARTALVVDTLSLRREVLAGTTDDSTAARLDELVAALTRQTLPLGHLAQVLVTHGGLPAATQQALREQLGGEVRFVKVDPGTSGFDAKQLAFFGVDARRCDWVVFADADCLPSPDWLQALLRPFGRRHPPAVVAGRTSYDNRLAGTALTALDFLYFSDPRHPEARRNFYVNNVAFRCDVLGRHAHQAHAAAPAAQAPVLGLSMASAGVLVHHAPEAHSAHRRPAGLGDQLRLRWQRGQAAVGLTPHLVRAHLPASLQWLADTGPLAPLGALSVRTLASLRALNHQSLPPVHGLRRLGAWGLILGFSAVEMGGALVRGLGWGRSRPRQPGASARAGGPVEGSGFASSRLS